MPKVVFITGAASGIGLGLAKQFAGEGAKVILCDKNEENLHAALAEMQVYNPDVRAIPSDVTNETALQAALDKATSIFGSIDVLVNNAGLQYISPIERFPTEQFELMIKVMLVAPFIAIRHVFPSMKKKGSGRIINMASINGLVGFAGKAAYNGAKHGVIGLTKVAALEGAPFGITVNAVCPGYVDTPLVRNQLSVLSASRNIPVEKVLEEVILSLVPQKRLLSVDEVTAYVSFLTTDAARGVTGQAIVIDGGYTAQ